MIFKSPLESCLNPQIIGQPVHKIIFDALIKHGKDRPNQPIFVDSLTTEETTVTQIYNRTCSIAHFLQQNGFQKGDLVLTAVENGWQYVCTMLACSSLGGGVAGSHPKNSAYELVHQIRLTKAKIVLCQDYILEKISEHLKECPAVHTIIIIGDHKPNLENSIQPKITTMNQVIKHRVASLPNVEFDPAKTVYFVPPSSGTTGLPKAVQVTHSGHLQAMNSHVINGNRKLDSSFTWRDQYVLLNMQCGFAYGQMQTLISMVNGTIGVFLRPSTDQNYCESVDKYKIALVHANPTLIQGLSHYRKNNPKSLSSVKVAITSGAPLKEKARLEFNKLFPHAMLAQSYSMTEGQVTIADKDAPIESVGTLAPDSELKVLDPLTMTELGYNQTGELYIRNNTLTIGYIDNPTANAELFTHDRFLVTGDIGYITEKGHIFLVDRQKEMIKVQGKSVAPGQLEDLLLANNKVKDCCVVGVPDDELDERIHGFVVKGDESLTEEECVKSVNENIIYYKHISGRVFFVDEIPRNLNGKVLRRTLREYVKSHV